MSMASASTRSRRGSSARVAARFYRDPATRESRGNAVPLEGIGSADDVAECPMFLASDAAGYVSRPEQWSSTGRDQQRANVVCCASDGTATDAGVSLPNLLARDGHYAAPAGRSPAVGSRRCFHRRTTKRLSSSTRSGSVPLCAAMLATILRGTPRPVASTYR